MKTRQKDRQHADNQSSTRFKEDIKEVSFHISGAVRTFAAAFETQNLKPCAEGSEIKIFAK